MAQRSRIVWPGRGRIVLALLVGIPAAMAYPWHGERGQGVLGVAAVVLVALFAWWRGQYLTTMVRRRLAMNRRRLRPEIATRATALLSVESMDADSDPLPLTLIAGYLDRYGIRAEMIRIISCHNGFDTRKTWIGLTVSAVENLVALRGRSWQIPLSQTAQVAARRLADQLRELGWSASPVGLDGVPQLVASGARETWRGVVEENGNYVAAYRVHPAYRTGDALSEVLAAAWSYPARETWTVLEIAGGQDGPTAAAACVFRTVGRPDGTAPVAGLIPQGGQHRQTLAVLELGCTQRLDGHGPVPPGLLAELCWPAAAIAAAR
ncbi:MAG: type VII secretion protein EccE [Mycobacteriaceae bacterium]|nr:type VII secretion protein EccE [Mycobacteriaceae bacterium]